ncbi:MAG: hypothetical protein ACYSP9_03520, partial [Planctomycetota bacterium]
KSPRFPLHPFVTDHNAGKDYDSPPDPSVATCLTNGWSFAQLLLSLTSPQCYTYSRIEKELEEIAAATINFLWIDAS